MFLINLQNGIWKARKKLSYEVKLNWLVGKGLDKND